MSRRRTAEHLAVMGGGSSLAVGVFSIWTAPLLVTEMMARRGISAAGAGGFVTMELLALAFASFLIAPRVNRIDKRVLAAAGTALAAAGFGVLAVTTDIAITGAFLVVIGLGQGFAFAAASGIAAASDVPDRTYGEMTVIGSIYGAAWLFLVPHAPGLFPNAPVAFIVATLLCLPFVMLCPRARSDEAGASAGRLVLGKAGAALMVAVVLLFCAAGALWSFADRMALALGLSARASGNLLAATTISGFLGSGLAAIIGTRFGRQWPIALAYAVTASCFLLACLAQTPVVFIVALIAQSAAQMYLVPVQFGLGAQLDDLGRVATAAGSMLLLGNALGPAFGGVILNIGGVVMLGWTIFTLTILSGLMLAWVAALASRSPPRPLS